MAMPFEAVHAESEQESIASELPWLGEESRFAGSTVPWGPCAPGHAKGKEVSVLGFGCLPGHLLP